MEAIDPPFATVTSDHIAHRIVLGLVADRNDHCDPMGSAVLLAPYCAVTAGHVLADYSRTFEPGAIRASVNEHRYRLRAFQLRPDRTLRQFRVVRAWVPPIRSDLALLALEPVEEEPGFLWPSVLIDLVPPELGSSINSFGFEVRPDVAFVDDAVGITGNLIRTVGTVTEVHRERHGARLDFPCVQTTALVHGGMSGGPVFSGEGRLVGVWCSSMPDRSGEGCHTATFSLLWPLLSASTSGSKNPEDWTVDQSLFAAALERKLRVLGLDGLVFKCDHQKRILAVTFKQQAAKTTADRLLERIRTRAYYRFLERVGRWWDPEANWLEAEKHELEAVFGSPTLV